MMILNTEELVIIHIPDRKYIYTAVVGFCHAGTYKQAAIQLNKNMSIISADSLLIDTSKVGVIRKEDMDIIIHEIFPLLRKIGVKKIAVIKPGNSFGQASIKRLMQYAEQAEIKVFNLYSEAESWLLNFRAVA